MKTLCPGPLDDGDGQRFPCTGTIVGGVHYPGVLDRASGLFPLCDPLWLMALG